jgi:hypothetical protein
VLGRAERHPLAEMLLRERWRATTVAIHLAQPATLDQGSTRLAVATRLAVEANPGAG